MESDVSTYSEISEGGTKYKLQKKRIRDADGNIIGYGDPKPAVKKKGSDIVTKGAYLKRLQYCFGEWFCLKPRI